MLSSNGVQFEYLDVTTNASAARFLESRGIRTIPVVAIGDEVVLGFDIAKLTRKLDLGNGVAIADSPQWLADKYDVVLGAVVRAARQLAQHQLEADIPERLMSLRDHILHVLSFAELACLSHRSGTMSTNDMGGARERTQTLRTVDELCAYGDKVRADIVRFLRTADGPTLGRTVQSHYGGEVSVQEVLGILLGHSTHHLRQVYWFMETHLGLQPVEPVSDHDIEGIVIPRELF